MNVFVRELKANRHALIIWCACLFLGVLSGMSKYTAYSSNRAGAEAINALPQTLRALLGMGHFDVATMSGFFAMLFLYIELAAALHAALLGSSVIAKEERGKTNEFLMTKPRSRSAILAAKLCAALTNVLILNVVGWISSLAVVPMFNKGIEITSEIDIFFTSLIAIQLIFLTLGVLLATGLKQMGSSGPAAAAIVVGCYLISDVTSLSNRLDALNVLSPFKYYSADKIVGGAGLDGMTTALALLLAAGFACLAFIIYRRRDLNV
ncbi:MAG: ABC transporter permease subunit [Sporolactobacillus sp.]